MPLRIPARNVGGDQIMESVTNANTREEQVVRLGGTFPIAATTGTITTATSAVTATDVTAAGTALIMIYGTYAGVNFTIEGLDAAGGNTNWIPLVASRGDSWARVESSTGVLPSNSILFWRVSVARVSQVRVRATAWTSGTANIIIDPAVPPGEPVVAAIKPPIPPNASRVTIFAEALAYTAATEALLSIQKNTETTNTAAATTGIITPTTGKTLVLQAINITYINPATAPSAAVTERFRLRYIASGTVLVTSAIQGLNIRFPIPATANASGTLTRVFSGEGLVIPSGASMGLTALGSAAAPTNPPTFDVEIVGYEF